MLPFFRTAYRLWSPSTRATATWTFCRRNGTAGCRAFVSRPTWCSRGLWGWRRWPAFFCCSASAWSSASSFSLLSTSFTEIFYQAWGWNPKAPFGAAETSCSSARWVHQTWNNETLDLLFLPSFFYFWQYFTLICYRNCTGSSTAWSWWVRTTRRASWCTRCARAKSQASSRRASSGWVLSICTRALPREAFY